MKSKTKNKHSHIWHYPYILWRGFKKNQTLIARYCQCGKIQIATTHTWKKADKKTKVYPDVIDECKKGMTK